MNTANPAKPKWFEAVILAVPFVAIAILWPRLPAVVPTHWNIHGKPNGWMSKPIGVLLVPVIAIANWLLLFFIPRMDPRMRKDPARYEGSIAALATLRIAMALFFCAMSLLIPAAALHASLDVSRMVITGALLLLLATGNLLSLIRPNRFSGIRTPWTLKSESVWRQTHRVGAYAVVFGSLIQLLLELVLSTEASTILFIASLLLFTAWSFLYSWRAFHAERAGSAAY